jgi:hypothetical protein
MKIMDKTAISPFKPVQSTHGPDPEVAGSVFQYTVDIVMYKAPGILRIMHVPGKNTGIPVKTIQSPVLGSYPKVPVFSFQNTEDLIVAYTVWIVRIMSKGLESGAVIPH